MKALTLYEPWASWIASGQKTIETRTHDKYKNLTGERIAIHAGQRNDGGAVHAAIAAWRFSDLDILDMYAPRRRHGQVVCTAMVRKTGWLSPEDSGAAMIICGNSPRRFGLFLCDIEPRSDTTVYKGHQGIWTWTPPSEAQLAAGQRIPRALA